MKHPTTLLVGHRGVGKSSLLAKISQAFPKSEVFDLDAEIERRARKSVVEIFAEDGEKAFRVLEKKTLSQLLKKIARAPRFIALGAGFDGKIPRGPRVVWVRRETDARGRIFTDRPRLNACVDPLKEFLERVPLREKRYAHMAHEVLTLREGCDEGVPQETAFFASGFSGVGGVLTLLPENFGDLKNFLNRRLAWGTGLIELRDDLLSPAHIKKAMRLLPRDKTLLSYRKKRARRALPPTDCLWDWDLDLGKCPWPHASILSCHTRKRGESLSRFFVRLEKAGQGQSLLKAAPLVRDFAELLEGHAWWLEDPKRRAFLPRSPSEKRIQWSWYRLFMKGKCPLSFWREGGGSAPDQPTLLEWVAAPTAPKKIAAVLGDPVRHSRTPTEHGAFFRQRGAVCVAIPVNESEWAAGALEALRILGLRYAAVTAPLKKQASRMAQFIDRESESANTLFWDDASELWRATTTDLEGLRQLLEESDLEKEIVVWGGGGVLPIVQELLPQASYYSSREGKLRAGPKARAPAIVIWAAGPGGRMPPKEWAPQEVVDLNYFEDSPGRAYALKAGAAYRSGLLMFQAQAAAQRRFWMEYGGK